MEKNNRVKAVISLDAVEQNFREMRKNIAEDTKMIAVVKADAYGHGAVPIAHLIEDHDYIWGFAAATAEEAVHLRTYSYCAGYRYDQNWLCGYTRECGGNQKDR